MAIETFRLPYSESAVQDLRERLARTRWPDAIAGTGWEYGFDREYLQSICRYWRERFDWEAEVERLGRLDHRRYRRKRRSRRGGGSSAGTTSSTGRRWPTADTSRRWKSRKRWQRTSAFFRRFR